MRNKFTFVNPKEKSVYIYMPIEQSESAIKGAELRRLRKATGHTQTALAAALGVTRETIGNWESGSWPDILTERGLAVTLGVPLYHFENHVRRATGQPERTTTQRERPELYTQLETLMEADPRQSVLGTFTLGDVQKILQTHIETFFKLAMPDGQVTVSGLRQLNRMLQNESDRSLDGHLDGQTRRDGHEKTTGE